MIKQYSKKLQHVFCTYEASPPCNQNHWNVESQQFYWNDHCVNSVTSPRPFENLGFKILFIFWWFWQQGAYPTQQSSSFWLVLVILWIDNLFDLFDIHFRPNFPEKLSKWCPWVFLSEILPPPTWGQNHGNWDWPGIRMLSVTYNNQTPINPWKVLISIKESGT